jgi:protein O-mannosyl-transferase
MTLSDARQSQHVVRRGTALPIALVLLVTVVALGRLCAAEFTIWDDTYNIPENNGLKLPIDQALAYYWNPGNPQHGLYVPMTYTAWRLIATIAHVNPVGNSPTLNPWIYHAANLALHLIATVLVYRILLRLLRIPWPAAAGAAVFALHPVQVEAVAWISGLKDVMAGMWTMAAILLYLRAGQDESGRSNKSYWLSVTCFVLAVLSKPSVMAMPLALAAVEGLGIVYDSKPRRDWLASASRLTPFFILAVVTAANAWRLQGDAALPWTPLWARPLIAGDSLAFYLGRLVWPVGLTVDYDRMPAHVMDGVGLWVNWLLPVILGCYCWICRRRMPALSLAFCFFVAGCLPNLGWTRFLFQYYSTVADHYLYPAMLGPALAVAWGLSRCARPRSLRAASAMVATFAIGACALLSFRQTAVWQDDFTLFGHALDVNGDCFLANNDYGVALQHAHRQSEALAYFVRSAELNGEHYTAYSNMAITLANLRQYPAAILALHHSLSIQARLSRLANKEPDQGPYWQRDTKLLQDLLPYVLAATRPTTRAATMPGELPPARP